ncbi:conserved exported hypothetical protein [Xanthomonas citri pv. bilvae]|nr:conserved exported hypothetical protein [Xanthomonas citri pv. bilvae]
MRRSIRGNIVRMSLPTVRAGRFHSAAWLLLAALCVSGCQRNQTAPALPGAKAEPAAAMQAMTLPLRRNDLVAYARIRVTPAQYTQLEASWCSGASRWPLTELPLPNEVGALLGSLSAPDAERRLQQAFDAQLAGQAQGIAQAAQSLGQFGVQYLRSRNDYQPEQRAHYVQLVDALSAWAATAPLADRPRAKASIADLTSAARATGITSDADLQRLGMEESLRRLGPFWETCKKVLERYDLSIDSSLYALRTGLIKQDADTAQVRLRYPLAAHDIDLNVALIKREGHWYQLQTQNEVQALLDAQATPLPSATAAADTAAAAPAKPADTGNRPAGR